MGDEPMITLRRANARHHDRRRKHEVWFTFCPDQAAADADGFGPLESLNEDRLPPAAVIEREAPNDTEIVTYVHQGAIAYGDTLGHSGVIHAGEFRLMTARPGILHSETNVSRTESAHVFQVWLRSSGSPLQPLHAQKRFSAAERRGVLCVVASPDGRKGSLKIQQDAQVYSAMLDPGQHVVHELAEGRSAWLHLIQGEVTLGEFILTAGDGAGITEERAVSLTAREPTEILLVDIGERGNMLPAESKPG